MRWVFCDENERFANWILFENTKARKLRDRYKQFQCPRCKKVDELAALASGIDEDVVIKFKTDFTRSYDGLICISQRIAELFSAEGVKGASRIPIPNGDAFILFPRKLTTVKDIANSGMKATKPCTVCGRPRERKSWPAKRSLTFPARGFDIAALDPCLESYYGRQDLFVMSEVLASVLTKAKATGMILREVL